MKKIADRSPEQYEDLMIEAVRVAPVGKDEIVVGFQFWDMDDFDVKSTLLFRVKGFREVQRLPTVDGLLVDLQVLDGDLFALEPSTLHVYSKGKYERPAVSTKLPFKNAKALAGARDALWVVGAGAARYDGKRWGSAAVGKDDQLNAVHVSGDRAYAAGDHGLLLELRLPRPRRLKRPGDVSLRGIHFESAGALSVAGGTGRWEGPDDKLAKLAAPGGIDFNDVCDFGGKRYWSTSGSGGGVLVQGKKGALARVFSASCWHLTATERFLYAAGEREVYRFDGERWITLGIAHDAGAGRWMLREPGAVAAGAADDGETIVVGTYEVKKPAALEKALIAFFDQRHGAPDMRVWKTPKGFSSRGPAAPPT